MGDILVPFAVIGFLDGVQQLPKEILYVYIDLFAVEWRKIKALWYDSKYKCT
jgi:hypothetical protein